MSEAKKWLQSLVTADGQGGGFVDISDAEEAMEKSYWEGHAKGAIEVYQRHEPLEPPIEHKCQECLGTGMNTANDGPCGSCGGSRYSEPPTEQ